MKKLLPFVFSVFLFGTCSEDDTITRTAEEQIPPLINFEFDAVPALDAKGFIWWQNYAVRMLNLTVLLMPNLLLRATSTYKTGQLCL